VSAGEYAFAAAVLAAAIGGAAHAVMYKRDSRSAAMWLLAIVLLPAAGPVLYLLFGVNRVERRAARMHARAGARTATQVRSVAPAGYAGLVKLLDAVSDRPLLSGNSIEPLVNGAQAYPAMLAAIDGARRSVALSSYIFHGDGIGERFVEALAAAHARGIAVRVLIDAVSLRLSRRSAGRRLRRAGVPLGVFNRTLVPARLHALHLRNHRKILVVDGDTAFAGGMNIDRRYLGEGASRDLHFRVRGPLVGELMAVFAEDWRLTTGEALGGEPWLCAGEPAGDCLARAMDDGPDETFARLGWAYVGGLAEARRSVRVCTPYFVPDAPLISALNAAALRGIEVDILLPERSDLPHVHWATMHLLWQVLECGCRVWMLPPPFDHSKLMVVDAQWTLFGSGNWDPRSLRLNFELAVECHGSTLGASLDRLMLERRAASRRVTLQDVDARSLPTRLRDGCARLFSPLL
jgi:cardiolipin synthase